MDANNFLLMSHCAKFNVPLIISTGMCNRSDLLKIKKKIVKKRKDISIMHCLSNYPSSLKDLNLLSILDIKKIFGRRCLVGYSDHTIGITACITSMLLGSQIIEKHFTLKKTNSGDHIHSSDEVEMSYLCSFSKNYKITIGKKNFFNFRKDLSNAKFFRRGVYA